MNKLHIDEICDLIFFFCSLHSFSWNGRPLLFECAFCSKSLVENERLPNKSQIVRFLSLSLSFSVAARENASFAFGLLTHSNVDCRWIFLKIFAKIVYLPLEIYRLPHFLLSSSRNVKDWQSVIRNGLWMVVHAAVFLEHLAWINLNDMKRYFRIFYLFYSFSYWQQENSNDDWQKTSKEQATTTTKKPCQSVYIAVPWYFI